MVRLEKIHLPRGRVPGGSRRRPDRKVLRQTRLGAELLLRRTAEAGTWTSWQQASHAVQAAARDPRDPRGTIPLPDGVMDGDVAGFVPSRATTASSSPLLTAYQVLAHVVVAGHRQPDSLRPEGSLESNLTRAMVDLFVEALRNDVGGRVSRETRRMMKHFQRDLAPLLERLPRLPGATDWRTLATPEGRVDVERLRILGTFTDPGHTLEHEGELLQLTRTLAQVSPRNTPDLMAFLGVHLRYDYYPHADAVDLGMVALALPAALKQLEAAQAAGNEPELRRIGDLLVCGLTFGLLGPDHYASHFVEWMAVARAQGVAEPERLVGELFRRYPEAPPALALFHSSQFSMLTDAAIHMEGHPERMRSGVDGMLRRLPEWTDLAVRPIRESEVESIGLPFEEKLHTAVYAFLRGLQPASGLEDRPVSAPLPRDVAWRKQVQERFQAVEAQIAPGARTELFARTAIFLKMASMKSHDPSEGPRLAKEWRSVYRHRSAWHEDRRPAYGDWHRGVGPHHLLQLTDSLADALSRRP